MAKQSGLGVGLLVGGVNLSGDIGSISKISGGPAAMDVTGIDASAFERIGGKRTGEIAYNSWFNKAAGASHLTHRALPTTDVGLMYRHGSTLGNPGAACIAKQVNYDPTLGTDGSLTFAVQAISNGFGLEWGLQLTAGTRTDVAATNGTGVDGAASTSFGWQAHLQVLAFTGTSVTVTLQDSADNVSFAGFTGSAFTAATAIGTQRIAGTNVSTVRRYVRAITTGTFSNAQFSVLFTRNEVAGVSF